MIIREMTIDDIPRVAAMEETDSQTPWSETALLTYFMRDDTILMVAEDRGVPAAFAGLLLLTPESEVLDITVSHENRRCGCGTALLRSLLDEARRRGITITYLEVRDGNLPAKGLYEKLGFEPYGRRANYYTGPCEDAIVMRLSLC